MVLKALDLGGVLFLRNMKAGWATGGAEHDNDCCLFKALGHQLCKRSDLRSPLKAAVMLRNEFIEHFEDVDLVFPGLHSVDCVHMSMIPHDLKCLNHSQCLILFAACPIPSLREFRIVIICYLESEAEGAGDSALSWGQSLIMASPDLLGGDAVAENIFMAVLGEHMMPVEVNAGTIPLVAKGTFCELVESFKAMGAPFQTIPSVGANRLVRAIGLGSIRLDSTVGQKWYEEQPLSLIHI